MLSWLFIHANITECPSSGLVFPLLAQTSHPYRVIATARCQHHHYLSPHPLYHTKYHPRAQNDLGLSDFHSCSPVLGMLLRRYRLLHHKSKYLRDHSSPKVSLHFISLYVVSSSMSFVSIPLISSHVHPMFMVLFESIEIYLVTTMSERGKACCSPQL
jgi:hypothetical protein